MSYENSSPQEELPTDLLANALQLMSQEWSRLSQSEDDAVAASSDLDVVTQRITSLLLARLVAVVYHRNKSAGDHTYADYSTVTICRTTLVQPELWPKEITPTVVQELQAYVGALISHYYPTGIVPYHNAEHAYHVTLSLNKLLDMVLSRKFGEAVTPPSFGLRYNPLALFSMVFAALCHDVEHMGVGNRVLSSEDNPLAVMYNDQSIAENRSLYVAFDEFLCPEYQHFRKVLCPQTEDYHNLRKFTINLVLGTDIASPEKTALGRSKWKEAFMEEISRRRSMQQEQQSGDKAVTPSKPHSSLASLNIGADKDRQHNSDDQSVDTFLTDSDEGTQESEEPVAEEPVPEQAPPSPPPPPRTNGTRYQRRGRGGGQAPVPAPTSPQKPIVRSATKKRLGIRRSMDLSGQVLEEYESNEAKDDSEAALLAADQPDELKMTVVMEVLMQAADVAHNLQSWDHMVEWSCRLYLELRRAYIQGRGPDVAPNWFKNQVGFLEMYLEPLAKKLDTVGVFGPMIGPSFAKIVKASRDRWLLDGMEVTQAVIDAGEEWYPDGEAVDPLPELPPRAGKNDSNAHSMGLSADASSPLAQTANAADSQKMEEMKTQLDQMKQELEKARQSAEQAEGQKEELAALQKARDEKEAALAALKAEMEQYQKEQEAERQKLVQQQERALQKSKDLEEAAASFASGSQWQTIVMILMGVALIWNYIRAPLLNNFCAPASPGTKIFSVESAKFEAPWVVPDAYKESSFFSLCGSRSRVQVENRKGKLTWIRMGEDATPQPVAKKFHHATFTADGLSVTDQRGKTTWQQVPWYQPY